MRERVGTLPTQPVGADGQAANDETKATMPVTNPDHG